MKITATVQRNDQSVRIEFPCDDVYLFNRLKEIGVADPLDCEQVIKDCGDEVPALSILNGKRINLDFLNFLAKRLDSFSKNELLQFEATLSIEKCNNIKDIINRTYNLHVYTLISDFSDLENIGKKHYLNTMGCITVDELETMDLSAVGRQLLDTNTGIVTPYGVLFENQLPVDEEFNGQTLPQFFYSECVFNATLSYNDQTETLYLPTEDITILKAINRLGAKTIDDCNIYDVESSMIDSDWLHLLCVDEDFNNLDIDTLNRFSRVVGEFDNNDFIKLMALVQYAEVHDLNETVRLAENIENFLYVPDVKYTDDLGRYMIQKSGLYTYDENLDEFYNYEMFGSHLKETQEGRFMDCGYVGISEDVTLSEILNQDENDMTMGGM